MFLLSLGAVRGALSWNAEAPRRGRGYAGGLLALGLLLAGGLKGSAGSIEGLPAAPPEAPPYAADGVIVAFQDKTSLTARLSTVGKLGLTVDAKVKSPFFARLRLGPRLSAAGVTVEGALAALRRDPAVRFAEPDYVVHTFAVPNDPEFPRLSGMNQVSAPQAWDLTTGGDAVIVGVIDTGIDYNHPDLRENILRDSTGAPVGYDFANGDGNPMDDDGHGTHVAGTIGARGNNGIGVAGVCWNVKLMPLKFANPAANGAASGSTSDAIQCIDYAVAHGARVLNNSWGGPGTSRALREAIQRARDAGVLFVAAAGNQGGDNDTTANYPSNYSAELDNVVSVAAVNGGDELPRFSNFGAAKVDLAAPGVNILSCRPGEQYQLMTGTSMATPHVAGAAALLLSKLPGLSVRDLKARLVASADVLPALQGRVRSSGRLNVWRALQDDPGGGTGAGRPAAPSGLQVTGAGAREIQLVWQDNAADESGYRVEQRAGDGGFGPAVTTEALGPGASSARVRGLLPGTPYTFRVFAFNAAGTSDPSGEAGGRTADAPLEAPSALRARPRSGRKVLLTWTVNSLDETALEVEYRTGRQPFRSLGPAEPGVSAALISGLAARRTYYFRVRALRGAARSRYSNVARATTLAR